MQQSVARKIEGIDLNFGLLARVDEADIAVLPWPQFAGRSRLVRRQGDFVPG